MAVLFFLLAVSALHAADFFSLPIWEKGVPGGEGSNSESVRTEADGQRLVWDVSRPTVQVFLPPAQAATGGAVIVCPGGGYTHLAVDREGDDVARWLTSIGIAGIVLRYRVIATGGVPMPPADRDKRREAHAATALEDGKRAVRMVRHRAGEWKIDPKRVAIMGFSAGGHVAANVSMNFDEGNAGAPDPLDRIGSRPDALIAIYPGRFEKPVFRGAAPPGFILHANNDPVVRSEYSLRLYQALKDANVDAELHIFASGRHGFGIRKTGHAIDQWPQLLRDWLEEQGWMKR